MPTHFTPEALAFLRGLARNNDRAWFDARKYTYETALKAPFLALIAELNERLATFSPEHVRPPQKIMMRIYRDIRFSKNKEPYKTHIAAWWAREGLEKTSGGGFYLHIAATEITVAAGVYMPGPEQLLAIRRYLLDHHEEFSALTSNKKLKANMQEFDGLKLTRAPKGFPELNDPAHPAAGLILQRQWGLSATLPAERALEPSLLKDIAGRFQLAAPLVALLNTPLPPNPASHSSRSVRDRPCAPSFPGFIGKGWVIVRSSARPLSCHWPFVFKGTMVLPQAAVPLAMCRKTHIPKENPSKPGKSIDKCLQKAERRTRYTLAPA